MARDCSNADDNVSFGTDPGIDDITPFIVSFWAIRDVSNAGYTLVAKNSASTTGWRITATNNANSNRIQFLRVFSGGIALWQSTTSIVAGVLRHIAVIYDAGAAANDPTIYVDGVQQTLAFDGNSTGTATSDATNSLRLGTDDSLANDLDGAIQNLWYDNATGYTAADINRMKWWGRRGGTPLVSHPLFTDKLANEGSATADGTASGTTVISRIPRAMRPGCGGW